jgi:1,2-diacylglycerol 3-beta-galactosyltransferase
LPKPPTLDFLFFDAGGGHRSAANALKSVIDAQHRGWDVRLVNLQEVLDPLDIFRKLFRIRLQDIYNLVLAKGWTLGSEYLVPPMHAIIRLYHNAQVKLLSQFWHQRRPDLVVSLIPNFNRALYQSLAASVPETPFVTVLTDLADYPPHFWMEKQPQYVVCGTERAAEQARALGYACDHIFGVSGMILRPQFYEKLDVDRVAERTKLQLDSALPTGLVLFGGEGSPAMIDVAKRLGNSRQDLQLIAVCGRNERLRNRLESLKLRNRVFVEGFTQAIPYYMALADFFIGKPGPGSISEAIQMKLPVVVERNAWTLPQERYNAEWITEHGVGVVLKSFRDIEPAVRNLLASGELVEMRQRAARLENRAVYEIPEILAGLLM